MGTPVRIGRDTAAFPGPSWPDPYLSRNHLVIKSSGGKWFLERQAPEGEKEKAQVFRDADRTITISEPWELTAGEWLFVSRKKRSTALCLAKPGELPPPMPEPSSPAQKGLWIKSEEVIPWDRVEFDYAAKQRLQVLLEELPRAVERWMERTSGDPDGSTPARSDEEQLFDEVSGALGLVLSNKGAGALDIAFLEVNPATLAMTLSLPARELRGLDAAARGWRFLNADPSISSTFRPSRRVLMEVLTRTVPGHLHQWEKQRGVIPAEAEGGSLGGQLDWVLAMMLKGSGKERGLPLPLKLNHLPVILYVGCHGSGSAPPQDFQPFLRTVALQISSLLETREHQRTQLQMARYFSPRLRQLARGSSATLDPVVFNCTVLFCDRRGSSLSAESAEDDSGLLEKLRENTDILGEVASEIFRSEGAIADFAGDGVLGFWGWPADERTSKHAMQAIDAAAKIAETLKSRLEPNPALSRAMREIVFDQTGIELSFDLRYPAFRIGISTGDMAVGNVGLREQMKIGVFGGPVNFGSRLESLGKLFRLPVIVSDETFRAVDGKAPLRKLCWIRPAGFEKVYPIYELILPREHGGSAATPDQVRRYEQALEDFTEKKFGKAIRQLSELVSEGDTGSVWLLETAQDFQRNRPPDGWRGEITATQK